MNCQAEWVRFHKCYEVNRLGQVRSIDRIRNSRGHKYNLKGKIMSTGDCNGYRFVPLYLNGKPTNSYIHRIVAQAFIPNPHNKPQVNHINGIKHDNRVENLEWVSQSENMKHSFDKLGRYRGGSPGEKHHQVKLTLLQVKEIILRYYTKQSTTIEMAKEFGIKRNYVYVLTGGHSWKHDGIPEFIADLKDTLESLTT